MSVAAIPDGALPQSRHHLFITGLGIGQIICWGVLFYAFPLAAEPMAGELGIDKPHVYGAATFGLLLAGFAAYPVGWLIDRGHGRAVMTGGALLGGLLFALWSQVHGLTLFYALFGGIGIAMAATLYEPAFAVVARRFGAGARAGITALTLWGGFASTVFVPVTQVLIDHLGWRDAVLILGLVTMASGGLYLWVIDPRRDAEPLREPSPSETGPHEGSAVSWALRQPTFWALTVAVTFYIGAMSGLTYHWYPLLLEKGFTTASVVAGMAIIGPAQVAGRIAIWALARRQSVKTIGRFVVIVFPLTLLLLLLAPAQFSFLALFAAVYGAANGIMTIVRGLALREMLTQRSYGALNGLLSVPATIAKALAPFGCAWLWAQSGGYDAVLAAGIVCTALVAASFWMAGGPRQQG